MSEDDRIRWDERHVAAGPVDHPAPPQALTALESLFPVEGRALEIACGRGEAAVWLAGRGMEVFGIDVSPVAVYLANDLAVRSGVEDRCRFEVWDLDEGLPAGPLMDLVICHMYREPRLNRELVDRLGARGLLAVASLSEVGVGPGRFRAGRGELRAAFAALRVLAEGEGNGVAWILGRKPG